MDLRLDTSTGIDIVGAAFPMLKPGSKYRTKQDTVYGHGYEELITPLQLLWYITQLQQW